MAVTYKSPIPFTSALSRCSASVQGKDVTALHEFIVALHLKIRVPKEAWCCIVITGKSCDASETKLYLLCRFIGLACCMANCWLFIFTYPGSVAPLERALQHHRKMPKQHGRCLLQSFPKVQVDSGAASLSYENEGCQPDIQVLNIPLNTFIGIYCNQLKAGSAILVLFGHWTRPLTTCGCRDPAFDLQLTH